MESDDSFSKSVFVDEVLVDRLTEEVNSALPADMQILLSNIAEPQILDPLHPLDPHDPLDRFLDNGMANTDTIGYPPITNPTHLQPMCTHFGNMCHPCDI